MLVVLWLVYEEVVMMGGDYLSMCKFGKNDKRFDFVWWVI